MSSGSSLTLRWLIRGAWMTVLMLAACSPEQTTTLDQSYLEKLPRHPNVIIIAPRELVGATVMIDESDRRMLWPDTFVDPPRWMFWRRLLGLPHPTPSRAKTYLQLPQGKHVLAITHDGYKKIVKAIEVGDTQQQVQITAAELVQQDSMDLR